MSQNGWSEADPAHRSSQVFHFAVSKVGFLFLACMTAAGAITVTAAVSTGGPKKALAALILAGMAWAAFLYKRPKDLFLFGWLFSLTYNRQYFIFQQLTGNSGMQGPYIIAADVFLLALFVYWYYESAILRVRFKPLGQRLWPWYLPFVAACLLSLWMAERIDWTLFEMIRVVKVGLILWYARYNLKARQWWICVAAIGCALTVQSILGVLEVVTRHSGVLWLLGQGTAEGAAPEMLQAENFYGFRRATATMNHPPNLACYLLLTIPLCAALALTHPNRRWRAASGIATVLGLACLVCTQSRWPSALIIVMLGALLIGLALIRTIPLKPALGILIICTLLGSSAGLYAIDSLQKRLKGDLTASVELRKRGNRAAFDMLTDHSVMFGVGLNNYRVHSNKYEPEAAWVDEYEAFAVNSHLRFIAGPLNGFLLVLTESGGVGLATFVIYLIGVTVVGIKAISATTGHTRAVVFALVIGFVGVLAQQAVDYSYWVDPILYTATLVVGMLNCAKSAQEGASPVRAE
jgi:hypothetical protein